MVVWTRDKDLKASINGAKMSRQIVLRVFKR